jgi:hypothetical protein
MATVRFQPGDIVAEVPVGTLIHEAGLKAGILDLELPCGGRESVVCARWKWRVATLQFWPARPRLTLTWWYIFPIANKAPG